MSDQQSPTPTAPPEPTTGNANSKHKEFEGAPRLSGKEALEARKRLPQHYKGAIEYLDDRYAYFLTHVLNMGRPTWTAALPTAAVGLPSEDSDVDDFQYFFNPDFALALPVSQFAFVMGHECMHLLMNHLALGKEFKYQRAANVAMDCIINDMLDQQGFDVPEWVMRGEAILGFDCSGLTVREVYDALMMKYPPQPCPTCNDTGKVKQDQNGQHGDNCTCPKDEQGEGDQPGEQGQGDQGEGDQPGDQGQGEQGEGEQGEGGSGQGGSGGKDPNCPVHGDNAGQGDPSAQHDHGDGQPCDCDDPNGQGQGQGQGQGDGQGQGNPNSPSGKYGPGEAPCPDCTSFSQGQPGDGPADWTADIPGSMVDDHDWINEATDGQVEKANEIFEDTKDKTDLPQEVEDGRQADPNDKYSKLAGTGQGAERQFCEQHGVTMKWAELLKIVNPDVFKKHGPPPKFTFRRSHRKMGAFVPQTNLPTRELDKDPNNGKMPTIVMALDTSGSVRQSDVDMFVTLARSIPKSKIKLVCCSFTSEYRELDLDDPRFNTGGTCFSAIEQFIRDKVMPENKGKYPKAVVVITDGYASFRGNLQPDPDQLKGWHWMLCHGYTPQDFERQVIPNAGSYHDLDNYVRQ